MAAKDNQESGDKAPTTLEDFLVSCQKSLARSVFSAQQLAKSDSEFAQGERPVYMVDEVEFDLNAGVHISPEADGVPTERVLLDFDAPGEQRSRLRFTVGARPVEILLGAKLELANLDPLGKELPDSRLRVWLVDDRGAPVSKHPVRIHFARAGERSSKRPIEVKTDSAGRIDFTIRLEQNDVKVVGIRKAFEVYLRGSIDQYFVWATTDRDPSWTRVVEPSAPYPPRQIRRDENDEPLELCSELLRLKTS